MIGLPSVSASSATRIRSSGSLRGELVMRPPTSVARCKRSVEVLHLEAETSAESRLPLPPGCERDVGARHGELAPVGRAGPHISPRKLRYRTALHASCPRP